MFSSKIKGMMEKQRNSDCSEARLRAWVSRRFENWCRRVVVALVGQRYWARRWQCS
jgi:hypothetical protein